MVVLYATTIFISAVLLFLLQPMFALMMLPLLGGAPAVWNTAVVFYQFLLLIGYLYAHLVHLWLPVRSQIVLHLLLVLLPFLFLPIMLPAGWNPPTGTTPLLWVLQVLFVAVGIPFFVVSTTSPFLQSWFARSRHGTARDPYFLYAASNVGSIAALLSYPFLIQPRATLSMQSWAWSSGYGIFAVLMVILSLLRWREARAVSTEGACLNDASLIDVTLSEIPHEGVPLLDWGRRVRWVALAFFPSSLMLSVTTYVTTHIAPLPLLWIVPLVLYLLTFIWAFSQVPFPSWKRSGWVLAALLAMLILFLGTQVLAGGKWVIVLHLVVFFGVALFCHGRLAEDRPHPQYLTEFYLWLSLGGVLGGMFSALVAPLLFRSVLEYPLVLIAVAYFFQWKAIDPDPLERWRDGQVPLILGGIVCGFIGGSRWFGKEVDTLTLSVLLGFAGLVGFAFSLRPLRFALGLGMLFGASLLHEHARRPTIASERGFFGVVRVTEEVTQQYRLLIHGTTIHGSQSLDPARRREPLSYYSARSPIGQLFTVFAEQLRGQRVAVVGLGTGSLACYRKQDQEWTFYEIDPAIVHFARDPRYFTFLYDCAPQADIVLGDARLSLAAASAGHYGLIILDAYSSDAIPVHLLTREALAVYLAALTDHGLLAFHISNVYFNLAPVVGNLAYDAGLTALIRSDVEITDAEQKQGHYPSVWVVVARQAEDLQPLSADQHWKELPPASELSLWTDNFSSVLSVFRKNKMW